MTERKASALVVFQWLSYLKPVPPWKKVGDHLAQVRDAFLVAGSGETGRDNLITLFAEEREFRLEWSLPLMRPKALRALIRPGHVALDTKARFRIHDNPEFNEGICGEAYGLSAGIRVVQKLPDVFAEDVSDEAAEAYSTATNVTVERVRADRPWARSYCAIAFDASGRRWVAVLSSRREAPFPPDQSDPSYRVAQAYLASVI